MKLESFKDKKVTRRKMILISLGVITIVGVSLLLYKTFASFSSEVSFRMMSGKVNYYGNADVLFGFYNGETKLDEMPQKGNPENLEFDYGTCDNGASVEWDEENWAPLVVNLTTTKTRCTLYFSENKFTGVDFLEKKEKEEQIKEEPQLMYDDTEDKNLRYVGANPNNYIDIGDRYKSDIYTFRRTSDDYLAGEYSSIEECESNYEYQIQNNEGTCKLSHRKGDIILWRIIGVMKNVTNVETNKKEYLIKIIRADSIGEYSWDTSAREVNGGYGVNEWSQADIMKLLNPDYSDNRDLICLEYNQYFCNGYNNNQLVNNSLYWNNESGQCYSFSDYKNESCDFTSTGISEAAKNKIAKVRWNTGTFATYDDSEWTASATYKAERSENKVCENCDDKVERKTKWDGYIGLINPSDFGYAIGKSVREECLAKSMKEYGYSGDGGCNEFDWLSSSKGWRWTLNPSLHNVSDVFYIANTYLGDYWNWSNGASDAYEVFPVAFLKSNVTISDALGTPEDPFIAS